MGIQLREFATWVRNRKILATLLVTVTLAIGMLIGTVISGHVGAAHPLRWRVAERRWRSPIPCNFRAPLPRS